MTVIIAQNTTPSSWLVGGRTIAAVPTHSQWGVIALLLTLFIFGVSTMKAGRLVKT